jgi:hypothetical protein
MNRLTPLAKGLITAVVMLGLSLFIFYTKQSLDSPLSYLMYALYAAGIMWTLIEYRLFINSAAKFGELFGQGFRCFIVITLVMVMFTGIFSATHPEFAEDDAKLYREYLEKEIKDKTPVEKDELVANERKQYTTKLIYRSIFGYLIIGSIMTAAGSGVILLRRK